MRTVFLILLIGVFTSGALAQEASVLSQSAEKNAFGSGKSSFEKSAFDAQADSFERERTKKPASGSPMQHQKAPNELMSPPPVVEAPMRNIESSEQ